MKLGHSRLGSAGACYNKLTSVSSIDPIGILIILLVELGQITPPMGMNLFVIRNITGEPLGSVIRGTMPFYLLYLILIALIILFPGLALWLPGIV